MKTTSQPVVTQLPPRLSLTGMTKRYPSAVANDGVSLTAAPGKIHAVLGKNGAGKSTLTKMIFGAVQSDASEMLLDSRRVETASPRQARALGVAMVFQHFSLLDTLTVAENILLDLPLGMDLRDVADQVCSTGEKYGLPLEPRRHVHTPSVGEHQRVGIVWALLTKSRLLTLGEPTSVPTPQAVEKLFVTLCQSVIEGTSILYISHKLDEIQALCHATTVVRMGKVTGIHDPRQETAASLSRMMIGGGPSRELRSQTTPGDMCMEVAGLSLPKVHAFATELRDIVLQLHSGEIVGIAGVSGNGQQELLAVLSGEDTRVSAQAISIGNEPVAKLNPRARRKRGLSFMSEERLGRGAVPLLSLAANTLLMRQRAPQVHGGFIDKKAAAKLAAGIIRHFGVKIAGPKASAKSLSDGNLQKFIVGCEIECVPRVLIVAQPTWGVDVGAAAQIHNEILALKAGGCTILIVSKELNELSTLCDRLYVIANERLSPSIPTHATSREQIGLWMSGTWDKAPALATVTSEVAHG